MRAHVSINVNDVAESVAFYEKVFGEKPQKQTLGYAKFDLKNPSLNFTMQAAGPVSQVSHFGIEVETQEEVKIWEDRLKQLGLVQKTEENVECCYAKQDKVWIKDPSGNAWEIFYVREQLPTTKPVAKSNCCA